MDYKEFSAGIRYNEKEQRFDGVVLGASADLRFHGVTIDELRDRFHALVDKHLARCESKRLDPFENFSGKLVLRIDPHLHRDISIAAYQDDLSLNKWIVKALNDRIARRK